MLPSESIFCGILITNGKTQKNWLKRLEDLDTMQQNAIKKSAKVRTKPKSKSSKSKNIMLMRIGLFSLWTIILPMIVAGLLISLAYSGSLSANVSGPYSGLLQGMMARYAIYAAYACIFIIGFIGLVYTFLKARHDWRYYTLSLILPVILIGWLVFGMVQQQIHDNNPDYKRYIANVGKCNDIFYDGSFMWTSYPSEVYKNIDKDTLNLKDFDDRVKSLYDLDSVVWKGGGVCNDEFITEDEVSELQKYHDKHLALKKELLLLQILDYEASGNGYACNFVQYDSEVEDTLPIPSTSSDENCVPHWWNWSTNSNMTTLELLRYYQNS